MSGLSENDSGSARHKWLSPGKAGNRSVRLLSASDPNYINLNLNCLWKIPARKKQSGAWCSK
ncbi:hypothetical protein BACCOPRO_03700 [Phocaeicola coprophilus DSM 18228 = JCM 13818]|uniref:Uncharacterized protein n=1 Tax=Phocaeicola coprophilus DSM 18228 = JCM 13818 TaxID=547042 RepID=S0FDF8_9BACT|nr:hypothetical protein BACCOPRO_03700 [Phocaeicola coprophilus DSM 18228 = JCM 13818]